MTRVIDKALDFIGGMDTSAPEPQTMDESTIKSMLTYLKDLGTPAQAADITARGSREGWSEGFTHKIVEWASRVDSGHHLIIKNPEYFSDYMRETLRELA